MIHVKNKAAVNHLASKSFEANHARNIIAVIAIALTAILFTSIFTMGLGTVESMQRAMMVASGGDGHAALKYLTDVQFETLTSHPLVKEKAYCRVLCDSVDNESLIKRHAELWYYDETGLEYGFATPTVGHVPEKENEIIADTKTLELLDVPLEVGTPLSLEITVHGKSVTRNFVLAGWWPSDPGFNVGQLFTSRSYMDAHAAELYNSYYSDSSLTGTITGYIKFKNSINIEQNLKKVVTQSGFSMDDVSTGINWAYMSTGVSADMGVFASLAAALLLFVLTGYLIIYNIFQISVLRDIRFYGLLKTIGTTGKQLRRIVRRQAMILSVIGIPLGLACGFAVGKALVPTIMAQTSYSGSATQVSLNPLIFVGSAIFALLTVLISTNKPAAMAARVSPIEAVRYQDGASSSLAKVKKSKRGSNSSSMALSNLGRNKKRTVLVILSLSLCIVLTNTVFTFSQSVDMDKALKQFCDSDFIIGHADLFNTEYRAEESALSESFISAVQSQDGVEVGGRIFGNSCSYTSDTSRQTMNVQPDGRFASAIYGLENFPLSNLEVIDGEIDMEKLLSGKYLLEGVLCDDNGNPRKNLMNHAVGDQLTLISGDNRQEMTVLGHVEINSNTNTDGSWMGSVLYLPEEVYQKIIDNACLMSYLFNVSDDKEQAIEDFLKSYTDDMEPTMNYSSKFTSLASLQGLQNSAVLIGGALASIVGLIGILNFVNAIITGLLTRRREFAMLESIGMTKKQLTKMICCEGICYALLTAFSSIVLSILLSLLIVRPFCLQIWFTTYQLVLWPLAIMIPLLFLISVLIPLIAYRATDKKSIVERLREAE